MSTPIEIRGDGVARMYITSKGVIHEVQFDVSDVQLVFETSKSWHVKKVRRTYYCQAHILTSEGKSTTISLHRLILNPPANLMVDHFPDHNGLNCRRNNLRIVTNLVNSRNRRGANSDSTSGYRGVSWHKVAKKWQAQVGVGGRHCYLGLHETPEAAAAVVSAFRALIEQQGIVTAEEAYRYAKAFRAAYRAKATTTPDSEKAA